MWGPPAAPLFPTPTPHILYHKNQVTARGGKKKQPTNHITEAKHCPGTDHSFFADIILKNGGCTIWNGNCNKQWLINITISQIRLMYNDKYGSAAK